MQKCKKCAWAKTTRIFGQEPQHTHTSAVDGELGAREPDLGAGRLSFLLDSGPAVARA